MLRGQVGFSGIVAQPVGESKNTDVKASDTTISIRGVRFNYHELVNPNIINPSYQHQLQAQLLSAAPYPHVQIPECFNPDFLQLILEEFDTHKSADWRMARSDMVYFHRSVNNLYLGPASEVYFSLINSGWFVNALSLISGVANLIVDQGRLGGGMHDTPAGGYFSVHSDFNRHQQTGLANKMVFITYLTHDWCPAWGGELELWDSEQKCCVQKIAPEFGKTLLMLNGPKHFHGHPSVWNAPVGVNRRSVANYYFINEFAAFDRSEYYPSVYITPNSAERIVAYVRPLVPPIVWQALRRVLGRP